MARKTHQPPSDSPADVGTDNVLIAVGVSAALIALIYLLLV